MKLSLTLAACLAVAILAGIALLTYASKEYDAMMFVPRPQDETRTRELTAKAFGGDAELLDVPRVDRDINVLYAHLRLTAEALAQVKPDAKGLHRLDFEDADGHPWVLLIRKQPAGQPAFAGFVPNGGHVANLRDGFAETESQFSNVP
jgi:hypothetical protein